MTKTETESKNHETETETETETVTSMVSSVACESKTNRYALLSTTCLEIINDE